MLFGPVEKDLSDLQRKNANFWMRLLLWTCVLLVPAIGTWSYATGGLCFDLFGSELSAEQRVQRLVAFFRSYGPYAPIAYVLFVTVEVIVAPIPGLILYAPGGLIFGPWLGGALAVIGNTIGAGISCLLARSLGEKWIQKLFDAASISRVQERMERHGAVLIFLLRLNPLTSNDLLSYAAGFTRIPVWKVMLSTCLGMAPLCFAQSWLSDSLFNRFPVLIYPLLGLSLIYLILIALIIRRQIAPCIVQSEKSDS